jgi:rod shape-determining protein MreD
VNPVRVAAVILGALVLQVCLFARFSFEGARPDVMILIAVAAGFVAGPERGAVAGFSAGVAFDVVLHTPMGLSAFVYTLVGYSVGRLSGGVLRTSWWIGPAVAAAACALGMLAYAVVATVFGQAAFDGPPLSAILVVVAAVDAVLAPLALRALRWTVTETHDRRHHPFMAR